jgi:hypothetical protein
LLFFFAFFFSLDHSNFLFKKSEQQQINLVWPNVPIPNCAGQLLTIDDLRTVQRDVWEARTKWYNIGLELDVDFSTLDAIRRDNYDIDSCFTEMLTMWLKRVNPPPTWSAMVEALRSPTVGYEHLTEHVSPSEYVSDVTDSGPTTESQEGGFIG